MAIVRDDVSVTSADAQEPPDGEASPSRRAQDRLITIGFGLAVIALWELGSRTGFLHELVVPSPTRILSTVPEVVTADFFPRNVMVTLVEVVVGFLLATATAFGLGVLVASSRIANVAIYPYIIALQSPPKIVLVPIFVTWFGFGLLSKIVMAAVIAFFPMFLNTYTGLNHSDREATKMLRSLTASSWQIFWKLRLPGSMPFVLTGVKLAWTMSVIGVIAAEFVGARAGIGFLIQTFNFQLKIPEVFVLIVILSLFAVLIYKLIERIERRIVFWSRPE